MVTKEVLDMYNGNSYVGSPESITGFERVYKYRDPLNFLEFLVEVDAKGLRKSGTSTSLDWNEEWSGAPTLDAAFEKFRRAKFDTAAAKKSSNLILLMRQGVKYTDTGDDISIPEYLSKNRDHWIEFQQRKRKKRPVLNTPIFLNFAFASFQNEANMARISTVIINKLYEYQVKAPKIVISYVGENIDNNLAKFGIFIDIPYFDFNSLKRFTMTSTFRKIAFVNYELVKGLRMGYGNCASWNFPKTLNDVISIDLFTHYSDEEIGTMMEKIIEDTFK